MSLTNLLSDLEQKGVRLWEDGGRLTIRAPKGALTLELRDRLTQHKTEILELLTRAATPSTPALPQATPDPSHRFEPFPLTDIQQAYWVGRSSVFELGNVSIHMYWELERTGAGLARLEQAWNRVVERHDMLRAVVLPDGRMQILEHAPPYRFAVVDVRGKDEQEVAAELLGTRERLSHQVLPVDRWPAFEIQATLMDDERTRLHISIDLVHIDASSLIVLFRDWVHLYRNPEAPPAPLELSFRDYIVAEKALRETKAYERSREYWRQRAAVLPPPPELPLARDPGALTEQRFARRQQKLDPVTWRQLKTRAGELGLTPSSVLLAAYVEVLRAWASQPDFTVNVTLFNRLPFHSQVNEILGDFTSMILLEASHAPGESFEGRAARIQKRLWSDLEYNQSSGVEALREVARVQQRGMGAVMPIVFTSLLSPGARGFQPSVADISELGEVIYEISQTPQVWLDHQVYEEAGALVFNWDAVEALFPDGMLDAMFGAYCRLVRGLADGEHWQETALKLIPAEQIEQREAMNATAAPALPGLLHTLFERNAQLRPDAVATVTSSRTLTYGQLDRLSNRIGRRLRQLGVQPNQLVAVVMEKGWEQVAAVLGVLKSGAAYLPAGAEFPKERNRLLLQNGGVEFALVQAGAPVEPGLPEGVQAIPVAYDALADIDDGPLPPAQCPGDLAYVLYTSGSTGQPKGVMIEHASVINRMADVAQRFRLKPEDRAIAITALHHDLSVFDIFGMLAVVGGSIVIPDAESVRDPAHWAGLIERHQVTLWNSVPTFLQMLVLHLENRCEQPGLAASLRWAILAGEFIPVDLPDRLRRLVPGVEIIAAGGPTETTVWDICYPIRDVNPAWKSIPYGRPMTNAQYHVLKENLDPCPVWVPGELCIAGPGLARGYWRDEERTAASFITHPETGQRLYRSGDIGRYLPDGNIEILGRKDLQVKIRGNRIELGEIEAVLTRHPSVQAAVVQAVGQGPANRRLVAYIVPTDAASASGDSKAWIQDFSDESPDGVLSDPVARLDFLLKQRAEAPPAPGGPDVPLTEPESGAPLEQQYAERRSCRQFRTTPVPFPAFSRFLACLHEVRLEGSLLPKRRYPSAGSLYPVRTYIYVAPERVEALDAGTYLYDPQHHRLRLISSDARLDRAIHAPPNQRIFDGSAFSLFLIGDTSVVEPMYGALARDFCMLEAGYMGQLLMTAAPEFQIALCPIGGLQFAPVRDALRLEDKQICVHSLLGGLAGEAQGDFHAAAKFGSRTEPGPAVVTELRRFLSDRLPDFMVPASFVLLESLPVTATGKLDRAALPSPEAGARVPDPVRDVPQNEMEQVLANALKELLPGVPVGVNDNFFDLGANSLHMVRFSHKLDELMRREVSVVNMFKYPTIRALAGYLMDETGGASLETVGLQAQRQIEAARRQRQRMEQRRDG